MKEITITGKEAGQTFHKFLQRVLPNAGGSFLYKMLRKKNITLNGKKADGKERLTDGDIVNIFFAEETLLKFMGENRDIAHRYENASGNVSVLYEDDDILILNKPSGVLSQKSSPDDVSINEEMIAYLLKSGFLTGEGLSVFRPSVCNRLDRNTSGILLCGKSIQGMNRLGSALKDRSLHKYYRCFVLGELSGKQRISGFLKKDEKRNRVTVTEQAVPDAQMIETEYDPLCSFLLDGKNGDSFRVTYLEVLLLTGRSHQIRAHLASTGHPLLGDYKYGSGRVNRILKEKYGIKDQMLHAYRIEGEGLPCVTAPVPPEFEKILGEGRENNGNMEF